MSFALRPVRADDAAVVDLEAALRGVNFDPMRTDAYGQGEGHNNQGNG